MGTSFNEYSEYRKGDFPAVPFRQGIYEISATQRAPLGTRLALPDERVFRYARAGALALAPGKFNIRATPSTELDKAISASVVVGAYNVYATTAAAATTAAEGWLQVNDDAGEGIQYKIKSAVANATTATSTDFVLYDPVATAMTAGATTVSVILNPYLGVLVATAITEIILGVAPVTVTALYYFWLQTWGLAPVWCEGVSASGYMQELALGTSIAGVTDSNDHTSLQLGQMWSVGVHGEYKPCYLRIAP
uniref:Uncharacterized protein n=1 Tax=viral metagenome TaxID=1070528 RepID=A0A6M3KU83_9ZZZZ